MYKKFSRLKNKNGASLIFVLGVMMLFLILGTSAIIAATSAIGTNLNKQATDNLELKVDSLQGVIKSALQDSENNAFKEQVLLAFSQSEGATEDGGTVSLALMPNLGGVDDSLGKCSVEIAISSGSENGRIVNGTTLGGIVTVTVEGREGKSIKTRVTYNLSGVHISGTMVEQFGEWRFVSYDKIDI